MPQYFGQLPGVESAWTTIAKVLNVDISDRDLRLECDMAQIRISVLATNLVRVRVSPSGNFLPRRSWAVAQKDTDWEPVPFETQNTETEIGV